MARRSPRLRHGRRRRHHRVPAAPDQLGRRRRRCRPRRRPAGHRRPSGATSVVFDPRPRPPPCPRRPVHPPWRAAARGHDRRRVHRMSLARKPFRPRGRRGRPRSRPPARAGVRDPRGRWSCPGPPRRGPDPSAQPGWLTHPAAAQRLPVVAAARTGSSSHRVEFDQVHRAAYRPTQRPESEGLPGRRSRMPHTAPRRAAASDPLATYRDKRDFARTPEPSGRRGRSRHADRQPVRRAAAPRPPAALRLPAGDRRRARELGGARRARRSTRRCGGPRSTSRTTRIEYIDFEGVIPAGEYGGGDVIVWDAGTWEPATGRGVATRSARGRRRAAHRPVRGEAARPVRARPHRQGRRRRARAGCCCTRTTSSRSTGGTPRTIRARCSAAAPTTRSRPTRTGCGARTSRPARAAVAAQAAASTAADRRRAGAAGRGCAPSGDVGTSSAAS